MANILQHILQLCFFTGLFEGVVTQNTCDEFEFAAYYSDHMVLQRAPTRARVWGYAAELGEQMTVSITVNDIVRSYTTTSTPGESGRPVWSVTMAPVEAGGPYEIQARNEGCEVRLSDVLFGDVWLCSGQSNMGFPMDWIDDPEEDLADVVNYPDVRIFQAGREYSDTPLEDLYNISKPWMIPTPEEVGTFSAVCWLYGVHLHDNLGVPLGLVQSCWHGTRIEAWSSPAALQVCFPDGVADKELEKEQPSVLYNAMIHPLLPMSIYGTIWYQGENNWDNPEDYGCAIQALIQDWRTSWHDYSSSMDAQFPFGEVQLAPNRQFDSGREIPGVRWAQSCGMGYAPNALLERVFMAVAIDTPDFDSPYGPIHPRYKRPVARRLALAGLAVAYGDDSAGLWQGPFPTAFSIQGDLIAIVLEGGNVDIEIRDTNSTVHYEVCCSDNPAALCEGEGAPPHTSWHLTQFDSESSGTVLVTQPCGADLFVVGIRYAWRMSPCPELEECAVYSRENALPAPPFLQHGLIQ